MKKAIAMILLGVMSLSLLAGCGKKRRDTGCVRYGTGNIHICTGGSAGK